MAVKVPELKHHRASGKARVWAPAPARRWIYLGPWGAPETDEAYAAFLSRWLADQRTGPATVAEIVARFMEHAEKTYPVNERGCSETACYRAALRPLLHRYGKRLAESIGVRDIVTLRDEDMCAKGWTRKTVNRYVKKIAFVWKWAAQYELIPAEKAAALSIIMPIRPNSPAAPKDKPPVRAVPRHLLDTVRSHLRPAVVADMFEILLLTGCRIGELCKMRPLDLEPRTWRDGRTFYVYRLVRKADHASESTSESALVIGPRARAIIDQRLPDKMDAPIFTNTKGRRYTSDSFRKRIIAACNRAGIEEFTTHQLRHNAATEARTAVGLDAAQARLGHRSQSATLIYAEADEKAIEVALKLG